MAWVSGIFKDASGNAYSIEGQASDVYLSDGRAASAALTSIATQAATLNTNITSLTTAVNAAVAAATPANAES